MIDLLFLHSSFSIYCRNFRNIFFLFFFHESWMRSYSFDFVYTSSYVNHNVAIANVEYQLFVQNNLSKSCKQIEKKNWLEWCIFIDRVFCSFFFKTLWHEVKQEKLFSCEKSLSNWQPLNRWVYKSRIQLNLRKS